jgi:hypothetical protein
MKKFTLVALVAILFTAVRLVAQPTMAPTAPTKAAADVVSVLSGTYTALSSNFTPAVPAAALNFYPDWGQGTTFMEFPISGNAIKKYGALDYQGIDFGGSINASSMTNLHWDIWTAVATTLRISLISGGGGGERYVTYVTSVGWNSFDVPLTDYTSQTGFSVANLIQFKFEEFPMAYRAGTKSVYLYNLYFWKPANVPALTGFSVPAKLTTDAPFTLTAPTSPSSGAFTYMSSNTTVATISGSTVTIVGAGTSIITANQAAAGAYAAGSTSATLVVTSPGPQTAAPTPTKLAANVTSMFSNAYTNVAIDTWSTSWDVADVEDVTIVGNATKKYTNHTFSGIEFTGANKINATTRTHIHMDVWTADAAGTDGFKVKLVDFGANGVYDGGGDDAVSIELPFSPTASGWFAVDAPLSSFTGLTTRANLAQMILVTAAGKTFWLDNVYLYSTPIPVELTYFKAKAANNTSVLTWQTASESNNQGFTIERSNDGATYAAIGNVKGNGTTSAVQNYTFTDNTPLNGVNYYRLRQTDFNGKETMSKVASVIFGKNTMALGNTLVHNTLEVVVSDAEKTPLSIFNVAGQLVFSTTIRGTQVLDVSSLTAGMYIVRAATGEARRFVKD